MEKISVYSCNDCENFIGCQKYCSIKMGENIVQFVSKAETVQSHIGEFRKDHNGKLSYVVAGYAVENSDLKNPIDIMVGISSMTAQVKPKLIPMTDVAPKQALDDYIKFMQFDDSVREKALEDFRLFNSNIILPTVVRPGAEVDITYKGFDGKQHKKITRIRLVKWMLRKDTGTLEASFIADVGRDELGNSTNSFKLSDYGVAWTLPALEVGLKTNEIKHKFIKMNNLGFVLPIEASYDGVTVAADGSHMYARTDAGVVIIGTFDGNKFKEHTDYTYSISKNKAFKEVKQSLPFLFRHRKFILPYCMSEINHIDV